MAATTRMSHPSEFGVQEYFPVAKTNVLYDAFVAVMYPMGTLTTARTDGAKAGFRNPVQLIVFTVATHTTTCDGNMT